MLNFSEFDINTLKSIRSNQRLILYNNQILLRASFRFFFMSAATVLRTWGIRSGLLLVRTRKNSRRRQKLNNISHFVVDYLSLFTFDEFYDRLFFFVDEVSFFDAGIKKCPYYSFVQRDQINKWI